MKIQISPRLKIALVSLLLILGAGFIFFAVFLNRGMLELTGQTPFTVEISGWQSRYCTQTPCQITLAPGEYKLKISREKSSDLFKTVKVVFQQTTTENLLFEAEPFIQPLGSSPLHSVQNSFPRLGLDFKNIRLEQLSARNLATLAAFYRSQTAMKNLIFSPDGNFSIYDDGLKNYLIKNQDLENKIEITEIPSGSFPVFSTDSNSIYYLSKKSPDQSQGLYQLNLENIKQSESGLIKGLESSSEISATNTTNALIYFQRIFNNYKLFSSPNQNYLAVIDFENPKLQSVYLIDLKNFSRKKIISDEKVSSLKFLPQNSDYLILEQPTENPLLPKLSLYQISTTHRTVLQVSTPLSVLDQSAPDEIVYAQIPEQAANSSSFVIEKLSLTNSNRKILYRVDDLDFPSILNSEKSGSNIYFQIQDNLFLLTLK